MTLPWFSLVAFVAAGVACGMAGLVFLKRQTNASYRSLASLLLATAVTNCANGMGLFDEPRVLFWREIATIGELVQPVLLLYVGLGFLNPADQDRDVFALWRTRSLGMIGLLLGLAAAGGQFFQWEILDDGRAAIIVSFWGHVPYLYIVIGTALGLAQLEVVLRASREPFRHKLKFIAIGLGGLAGYQIYQASQMLMFSVWQNEHVGVSGIVTALALGLIGCGLGRSRLTQILVHAYVSPQALLGSVTFIAIGLYLVVVGAMGAWLRETNQPLSVGLSVVVVFGALVALVIAIFSKTVRAQLRRFITRNFYRSKYDYRAQWLQVTEVFHQAADNHSILDRLMDVLIRTFPTTHISIWVFREPDRRFCRVRSMTGEAEPEPIERCHPIIDELEQHDNAVWVSPGTPDASDSHRSTADPIRSSGAALCFPIRAKGQVIAFIALGPQLHGEPYGTDDEDLLRGIAHHVGMLLAHASLVDERRASAELEALHRFSIFCLHDLKNLAARLSLVAQNAQRHGNNPVFQESAMRTVADTADKMAMLMSKLSQKTVSSTPTSSAEPVDLLPLIHEIVEPLRGAPNLRLQVTAHTMNPVRAVREQIHQVLLNVILNAKQAMTEDGEISIELREADGCVTVVVADTGCGIPRARLETLFLPSQSSRPGGLGVGLYQCKQIVEAHGGMIRIRSEWGKGTKVTIELPVAPRTGDRGPDATALVSVLS